MVRTETRQAPGLLALTLGAFLILCLFALSVPIDHDEGQYIAATRLVAEGWRPILDFPYLQTPLQPYLLAPLQWIAPGWLLISSRIANALFVVLAAALTGRTAAAFSGRASIGVLAAVLLLLSDSVLFAGTVARNDAVPMLLLALGLERLWSTPAPGKSRVALAGLALAAAASTKISYALPAAAVAAAMLWTDGRARPGNAAALLGGMLTGALPTILTLATDPHHAWFWMVTYSVDGVEAFQALNQSLEQLGWPTRLARFAKFAALGPLLVLLGVAVWTAWKDKARSTGAAWLGPLLLAALIAALLPKPMYRQYLVPLAVPLILWLAARGGFDRMLAWKRPVLIAVLTLFAASGLFRSVKESIKGPADERPLAIAANARTIGVLARSQGVHSIASLDAITATDTGLALDRRFAPGPFLFRAGNLAHCRDEQLCPVTFANLTPLDRAPPRLILVTGTEAKSIGPLHHGLEGPLVAWASQHGAVAQSVGGSTAYWVPKR